MNVLTILLCVAINPSSEYDQAYNNAMVDKKPLVVLIGADWCDGCRVMKHGILPKIFNKIKYRNGVHYTVVDCESEIGKSILNGSDTIPQVAIFVQSNNKWIRKTLIGTKAESEVELLLDSSLNNFNE